MTDISRDTLPDGFVYPLHVDLADVFDLDIGLLFRTVEVGLDAAHLPECFGWGVDVADVRIYGVLHLIKETITDYVDLVGQHF